MKQTWGRFFSPLIGVNLNYAQLRTGSVSAMMIATVYAILKLIIKYASIKKCILHTCTHSWCETNFIIIYTKQK